MRRVTAREALLTGMPAYPREPFGALIDRWRRERGLSLRGLADRAGLSTSTLQRWRDGMVREPQRWRELLDVAKAFDLPAFRASRLLQAAGFPALEQILEHATSGDDRALLARWDRDGATPTNLRRSLTSFVGREDEAHDLAELLYGGRARLVSLTGTGGTGKTRLATEVARGLVDVFPDGVYFVDLAPIAEPSGVLAEVARALQVPDGSGASTLERLSAWIGARRMLLVLDNFEHLAAAGPDVAALVGDTRRLVCLVTSRVPLRVTGEHERAVEPLPVAELGDGVPLDDVPAARLFADRARAAGARLDLSGGDGPAVVAICRMLDGLPLCIELAAARSRMFPPRAMLARFSSRLDMASGGPVDAPPRHRDARSMIAWSVQLLSPRAQALFARLGVFASGAFSTAVAAICRDPDDRGGRVEGALDELVESRLVGRTDGHAPGPRYTMLETVRELALEFLVAAGEADALRRAHAEYFVAYAALPRPYLLLTDHDPEWVARLDRDYANVVAALRFALDRRESEMALRLVCALWPYWQDFGLFREGTTWLALALAQSDGLAPELRAEALTGALALSFSAGNHDRARELAERCYALWQQLGDHRGMAIARLFAGLVALNNSEFEQAVAWYQESAAHWEAFGNTLGAAKARHEIAFVFCVVGRLDEARSQLKELHHHYAEFGDEVGLARAFTELGFVDLFQHDPASAIPLLEEGVRRSRPIRGHQHLLYALFYSGLAHLLLGQLDEAAQRIGESLRSRSELTELEGIAYGLFGMAAVASRRGHAGRSALLLGAAFGLVEAIGIKLPPVAQQLYDSEVAGLRAQLDAASFAMGMARGRALSLAEAVHEALEETATDDGRDDQAAR